MIERFARRRARRLLRDLIRPRAARRAAQGPRGPPDPVGQLERRLRAAAAGGADRRARVREARGRRASACSTRSRRAHPQAFAHLLQALDFHFAAVKEVALVGPDREPLERDRAVALPPAPRAGRRRAGRRAAARGPRAGRRPRRGLRLRALRLPAARSPSRRSSRRCSPRAGRPRPRTSPSVELRDLDLRLHAAGRRDVASDVVPRLDVVRTVDLHVAASPVCCCDAARQASRSISAASGSLSSSPQPLQTRGSGDDNQEVTRPAHGAG